MMSPGTRIPLGQIWSHSLANRISCAVILIVIAVIVAASAGLIWISYNEGKTSASQLLEKKTDYAALLISDYTTKASEGLSLFASTSSFNHLSSDDQMGALEDLLLNRKTVYTQLTMLNTSGAETNAFERIGRYECRNRYL